MVEEFHLITRIIETEKEVIIMRPLRRGWLAQDDTIHSTEHAAEDRQIEIELIDWMRLKFNERERKSQKRLCKL